jgi:hypothetical protein
LHRYGIFQGVPDAHDALGQAALARAFHRTQSVHDVLQARAQGVGCRQVAVERGRNLEAAVTCTYRVLGRDGDDAILDHDAAAQINIVK